MTQLSSEAFPEVQTPQGWSWDSDWSIDTSQSYGDCEGVDGWMYGPSFDKLFESILSKTSTGGPNSKSMVRCRRWLRRMVCSSTRAERSVLVRLQRLCTRCELYDKIYHEKDDIHLYVQEYEQRRTMVHEGILSDLLERLYSDLAAIKDMAHRLIDMKNYCTMRAAIDKEYSKKLMSLSLDRYQRDRGDGSNDDVMLEEEKYCRNEETDEDCNPRSSTSSSRSWGSNRSSKSITKYPETILLTTIDQINYEYAERFSKLSTLLSSVMMEDLDSLIMQSQQVYHSYEDHISHDCKSIESLKVQITGTTDRLGSCLKIIQSISTQDIQRIRDETDAYNGSVSGPASSTVNDLNTMLRSKYPVNEDLWICLYTYRKCVFEISCILNSLQQVAKAVKILATKLTNQCCSVITTIARFLADEQARIWIDCGEQLQAALKSSSSTSRSNSLTNSNGARAYAMVDPPPSPNRSSIYLPESEAVYMNLSSLLAALPPCPKVIMREVVEVTSIESLSNERDIMIELDWFTSQLVLTTDGYIHILKTTGFERPLRSFNTKACDVRIEAAGFDVDRITNCVSILPWTLTSASGIDASPTRSASFRDIGALSNHNVSSSSHHSPSGLRRGIESSAGLVIYFSSPRMAEELFKVILDLSPLVQLQHPDQDILAPSCIPLTSRLVRESSDGTPTFAYYDDSDENVLHIDTTYGDLSCIFKPPTPIPPTSSEALVVTGCKMIDEERKVDESPSAVPSPSSSTLPSPGIRGFDKSEVVDVDTSDASAEDDQSVASIKSIEQLRIDTSAPMINSNALMEHLSPSPLPSPALSPPMPVPMAAVTSMEIKEGSYEGSGMASLGSNRCSETDKILDTLSISDDRDHHSEGGDAIEYLQPLSRVLSSLSSPSERATTTTPHRPITESDFYRPFLSTELTTFDTGDSAAAIVFAENSTLSLDEKLTTASALLLEPCTDNAAVHSNNAHQNEETITETKAEAGLHTQISEDISISMTQHEQCNIVRCDVMDDKPSPSKLSMFSKIIEDSHLSYDITMHLSEAIAVSSHRTDDDKDIGVDDGREKAAASTEYYLDYPEFDGDFEYSEDISFNHNNLPTTSEVSPTYADVNEIAALTYLSAQAAAEIVEVLDEEDDELVSMEALLDDTLPFNTPPGDAGVGGTGSRRRKSLLLNGISEESGNPPTRSAAIRRYQLSLYDSLFAGSGARRNPGRRPSYKPPKKIIPSDVDPSAPFAKRNSERIRQYQQGLAQEKEKSLQKMTSMKVHLAAMSKLLTEFKSVGPSQGHNVPETP